MWTSKGGGRLTRSNLSHTLHDQHQATARNSLASTRTTSSLLFSSCWTQPYSAIVLVKYEVTHHFETAGQPVHAKVRSLAPECYCKPRPSLCFPRQGIVLPSNRSSALHVVRKKNGGIRPCGGHRHFNLRNRDRQISCAKHP